MRQHLLWNLGANRAIVTLAFALFFITFRPATLQAQDKVLEAAQQAARLNRPLLFEGAGGYRLYEAKEGKDRLVFSSDEPIVGACLSSSSKLLAVGSYQGGQRRIWISDLAGRARPATGDHSRNYIEEIGFSPDDRYVAYQIIGHTIGEDVLYLLDLQKKRHYRITPEGMASKYFSWSPDGTQLAIGLVFDTEVKVEGDMVMVERQMDVAILDVATRKFRRLTRVGEDIFELAWSPDGKWIAFKHEAGLSIVAAELKKDAHEAKPRLLTTSLSREGPPRWSPDSKSLAVSQHDRDEAGKHSDELIVVPLEGEARSYKIPHQLWHYDFSPAGDAVAYSADDRNLTLVNLTTDERQILVEDIGFWSQVAWASRR